MWWIVAVVGALFAAFIFARFRSASRHQALVNAVYGQARTALFAVGGSPFEIDPNLWLDRYILGYIQGMSALTVKFYGGKMTVEQKGLVLDDTLKALQSDGWQDICERIASLAQTGDAEFARGFEHAANVIGLASNRLRPEFMADPDVQAAMKGTPELEQFSEAVFGSDHSRQSTPYSTAAGALISRYMLQHKVRLQSLN